MFNTCGAPYQGFCFQERVCACLGEKKHGRGGHGNTEPSPPVHVVHDNLWWWWLSPWPRQLPDASMGPNAGLLTGDVDNILWCSSGWKVLPWTGSHCVWCRASEGVLVFLCRGNKIGVAAMLTPSPIACAVTAPQALHVNMLTEPLYRVECVYTVATLKNSSDSSTNVDCKFLTQYQKKLDGANFRFVCGKGFYHVSDCPQSKKIA